MKVNKISVLVGGEAGAGVNRSGFLFGKACLRGGFHVFGTNDYGSLIRGGHNSYTIRVDAEQIFSQEDTVDLLLALDKNTILRHKDELVPSGGIVFDAEQAGLDQGELGREDLKLFPIPFRSMVKDLGAQTIVENTIALGAAVSLLDYHLEILNGVLRDTFQERVAEANILAAKAGYDYAREHHQGQFNCRLEKLPAAGRHRILLLGNEAVGLGALQAGCKFYAAYPMTPSTGLLHFLAAQERNQNMVVIQGEGEIACINMVAGASFAGARAMTATSGGGFCLMSEGLGMMGMTETPGVIMVAQRPGPSTGLPTYSGQGDLRFLIHASQGEFPRVVIAPGDVEECFYETMRAFNYAEKYQIPVILITDKHLAESHYTAEIFDLERVEIERGSLVREEEYQGEDYNRYELTESGISLRAIPGTTGALVRANADEHDERGLTAEDPDLTTIMMDKRLKKVESLREELRNVETVKLYGPEEVDLTIIAWGSTKGPIREAMKILEEDGPTANFLQVLYLAPFPVERVNRHLKSAKTVVVVENNATSQLTSLIREYALRDVERKVLKYDGRPFDPRSLATKLEEVL